MGSTGLTTARPQNAELASLLRVALIVWALSALACVLVGLLVGLVPAGHLLTNAVLGARPGLVPHSTSGRSIGYALGLLVNNAVVALWPLTGVFLLRGVPCVWRRVFTALVALSAVRSIAPIAAALGLWGARLLPYIPNAPFELAAITTGGVLYVLASDHQISARGFRAGVLAVVLLLLIAAALETWAVRS